MNKQFEALLDLLSWTPLARFIRTYRIEQLQQRTLELRMTKNIDLVFDGILKHHSDLLS
tara:strand:- start:659 stop:835 length:177 start_codon:yes stop_codon:yes gene_type:complete